MHAFSTRQISCIFTAPLTICHDLTIMKLTPESRKHFKHRIKAAAAHSAKLSQSEFYFDHDDKQF